MVFAYGRGVDPDLEAVFLLMASKVLAGDKYINLNLLSLVDEKINDESKKVLEEYHRDYFSIIKRIALGQVKVCLFRN